MKAPQWFDDTPCYRLLRATIGLLEADLKRCEREEGRAFARAAARYSDFAGYLGDMMTIAIESSEAAHHRERTIRKGLPLGWNTCG